MYILNQTDNNLQKAKICTFSELNLSERQHLQEWIAAEPSSLGEELLIIQKEFDGFADTKERLDLLALDKQGCLVIIENKLDDSGRDVTWQAIKYASYCSSLSKTEIIQIFQKYLGTSGNAEELISEFIDKPIEEIELNPDNSQRIFFVAANFRKEVTSSVLWLINFNLRIKCFKVTPYQFGDRIFIDFDQLIPIKDTEDYTIKMATKKREAAEDAGTTAIMRTKRAEFWQKFIEYNAMHHGPFAAASGTPDTWLGKSIGVGGISCNVIINKSVTRTEIYFNLGFGPDKNKEAFDFFKQHQAAIEAKLSQYQLEWQRMDDKVTCRICVNRTDLGFADPEQHEEIIKFLTESSQAFIETFSEIGKKYKKAH